MVHSSWLAPLPEGMAEKVLASTAQGKSKVQYCQGFAELLELWRQGRREAEHPNSHGGT